MGIKILLILWVCFSFQSLGDLKGDEKEVVSFFGGLNVAIDTKYKDFTKSQLVDLALKDDSDACCALGNRYAYQKKYETAYKWFKRGADRGNILCLVSLSLLETYGMGCKKDPLKVMHRLMPYMRTGSLRFRLFLQNALTEYLEGFSGNMTTEEAFYAMEVLSTIHTAKIVGYAPTKMRLAKKMNKGLMWAWQLDADDEKKLRQLGKEILKKMPEQKTTRLFGSSALDAVAQEKLASSFDGSELTFDTKYNDLTKSQLVDLALDDDFDACWFLGNRYAYERKYETAYKWFKRGTDKGNIACLGDLSVLETYGAGCKKDPLKVMHRLMPYMKTGPLWLAYSLRDALTEYLKGFSGNMTTEEADYAMEVLSTIRMRMIVGYAPTKMRLAKKKNKGLMWAWQLDADDEKNLRKLGKEILKKMPEQKTTRLFSSSALDAVAQEKLELASLFGDPELSFNTKYKDLTKSQLVDLALKDDFDACWFLGRRYAYERKYETAYKWFKRGADKGNIACLSDLSVLETYGGGCKKDPLKAMHRLMPYMKTGPVRLAFFLQKALTEYLEDFSGNMTTEEAFYAMEVLTTMRTAKRVDTGRFKMRRLQKSGKGFMWAWELDAYDEQKLRQLGKEILKKMP